MQAFLTGRLRNIRAIIAIMVLGGWYQPVLSADPYKRSTEDFAVKRVTIYKNNDGLKHSLWVFYPEASRTFPVMIFLGGLNGIAPGFAYSDLAAKLAAKGVILVIPIGDVMLPHEYNKRATEFIEIIAWMKESFGGALMNAARDVVPTADIQHIILSGHSSGAQAIVGVYRQLHEEIGGIFFMDPVDGDPFNMLKPSIEKDEKFFYNTPILVIASGLGDQPGFNQVWWPACAPAKVSGYHFYDSFVGPKWYLKAVDYGHADMLDDLLAKPVGYVRFCKGANQQFDRNLLRDFIAGAIYGFIDGVVNNNPEQLRYLTDKNLIPLKVELKNE